MPIMASCSTIIQLLVQIHLIMLDYIDGYKVSNDHCDVTLDNYNDINNKDDEITDNKITHIDDDYNLIVFDDETITKSKLSFMTLHHLKMSQLLT